VFRNTVHHRKGCSAIRRLSSLSVKSSTFTPISGPYYPCALSDPGSVPQLLTCPSSEQVSKDPSQKPDVDLVVVRENTECLVCASVFLLHHALDTIGLWCGSRSRTVRQARSCWDGRTWARGQSHTAHNRTCFQEDWQDGLRDCLATSEKGSYTRLTSIDTTRDFHFPPCRHFPSHPLIPNFLFTWCLFIQFLLVIWLMTCLTPRDRDLPSTSRSFTSQTSCP
jgi:hypothetical protein